MKARRIDQNWEMHTVGKNDWQKAVVPGSVYTDLFRNGNMEDPFYKDNEDRALKLMDQDYEYKTVFDVPEKAESERISLHFYGIDTLGIITLNGTEIARTDNMHREWELDVTSQLREKNNELKVVLQSPTRFIAEQDRKDHIFGAGDAMPGFMHLRKAHCMFGWDWGAHLPDAGIFRPVELRFDKTARIENLYIVQRHEEGKVNLLLKPEILSFSDKKKADSYTVTVTAPDGSSTRWTESPERITIEQPELWWPNEIGSQPLYLVTMDLFAGEEKVDSLTKRIGLRTLTVKREPDQYGESFEVCVNGVSVFAMGADYIPEDHLLGRVTKETTRTLLEKAKFAHFNSIRVWGGGYYPEDWFYDLCDEMGLMVWQDFMFACSFYHLTPEFEASIRAEFIDNIKRLRHHPSLALWCGNNEMEMFIAEKSWTPTPAELRDYVLMYERIIPEELKRYDPETFYWPASPSSGGGFDIPNDENRGDVHYWDVWHGNRPFTAYREFYFRYVSEFGFQSFPSEKTVDTFTDDENDKNIFSYIMEKHQRNGAANGKIMNYMQQTYKYPTSFDALVYASQLLQADAVRYGVEHFRRNRGRCMGAIYWQLNDCWPVASWASVDYCGRLKALHYAARRFFAPVMVSCEEHGMMDAHQVLNWLPFEFDKSIRLNVTNESPAGVTGKLSWELRNADGSICRAEEEQITVPAFSSIWRDRIELPDADIYNQYVSYRFEPEAGEISEGTVLFSYPKYFRYLDPQLSVVTDGDEIVVSGNAYASKVEIRNEADDLILSDNYFDLNGGEKRVKILSGKPEGLKVRSIYNIK